MSRLEAQKVARGKRQIAKQEIELRRNDEYYLESFGAERIPDPTTTGDFCRRMNYSSIGVFLDAIDEVGLDVWNAQDKGFKKLATIDMDRWDADSVEFVFGIAKHANLMAKIDEIAEDQWKPVPHDPSCDPSTPDRARPDKIKREIFESRGYRNCRLKEEVYVEVPHKLYKCVKTYRLIIVRKKQDVTEQGRLFEDDVYFSTSAI